MSRIFATDMYSLADNSKGAVYILDGWNEATHWFQRAVPYLVNLRNPNNVAFYTDASGAELDLCSAYRQTGAVPVSCGRYAAERRAGGTGHLSRLWAELQIWRLAPDPYRGGRQLAWQAPALCRGRIFLQRVQGEGRGAGDSLRDGSGREETSGLSRAVYAMLSDWSLSLRSMAARCSGRTWGRITSGDGAPEDTFFELDSAKHPAIGMANYGWPTCYFEDGVAHADRRISAPQPGDHTVPAPPAGPAPAQFDCAKVPAAYTTFRAHSSPLGVAWFGDSGSLLKNSFLVALHGAGKPRIGVGYKVVRFSPDRRQPQDFITGFYGKVDGKPVVAGRPCGMLQVGPDRFLLTDDHDGVVYFVGPR